MQYSVPSFSIPIFGLPSFSVPETPTENTGLQNETIIYFEFNIFGTNSSITPELYKYISDRYGLAYKETKQLLNNVQDAVTYIAKIKNPDAKIDLLKQLRTNQKDFDQNKLVSNLYPAVRRLNDHVLNRTGKNDINDWLLENDIKVIRNWAALCEETGIVIQESNISIES